MTSLCRPKPLYDTHPEEMINHAKYLVLRLAISKVLKQTDRQTERITSVLTFASSIKAFELLFVHL